MRGTWWVTLALAGCVDDLGPRLETATPSAAGRGAQVMLSGSRLCGSMASCETAGGEILLGLNPPVVRAAIVEYSDTAALIEIPPLANIGPTSIIVTVNERASNALDFEVLP